MSEGVIFHGGTELELRPVTAMSLLEERKAASELYERYGDGFASFIITAAAAAAAGAHGADGKRIFSGAEEALDYLSPDELNDIADMYGLNDAVLSVPHDKRATADESEEINVKDFTYVAKDTSKEPVMTLLRHEQVRREEQNPTRVTFREVCGWFERDARRYDEMRWN